MHEFHIRRIRSFSRLKTKIIDLLFRIESSRLLVPLSSSSPLVASSTRVDTSRCSRGEDFRASLCSRERTRERKRQRPVLINFSILARSRYDRLKLIPTPGTDASPLKREITRACRSAPSRANHRPPGGKKCNSKRSK